VKADTLFVSYNNSADTIEKYTTAGISGVNTDAGSFGSTSDVSGPNGIAFDKSGNMYVANSSGNTITEFSANGTYIGVFASGLNSPAGLAFDQYGNLYVANNGNGTVDVITPSKSLSLFASGLGGPDGLAFGPNGDLYVANGSGDTIEQVTPAKVVTTYASADGGYDNINDPMGLAFDSAGNLYIANFNLNDVEKITPGLVQSVFLSNGSNYNDPTNSEGPWNPVGLAFDSSGDLYVANYHHTQVGQVYEGSGYSYIDEYSSTGTLVNAFNDANTDLRDASYLAIENAAGVPLLEIPEPSPPMTIILGGAMLLGYSRFRRRWV